MTTSPNSKQKSPSKTINNKRKRKMSRTSGAPAEPTAPDPENQERNCLSTSSEGNEGRDGEGTPVPEGREAENRDRETSGFIFMCSGKTKPECYRYRVFGLPKGKIELVEKIGRGTRLFLFDFDVKLLYGIYRATSRGGLDLEKNAFGGRFSAQVKFKIEKDCLPLPESSFKNAILENYNKGKFTPELNSKQVRKLMSLFQPLNIDSHRVPPPVKYVQDWNHTTSHARYEDQFRRVPVASPPDLAPEDPYRYRQLVQAPPPEELRYTHQLAPSTNDPFVYSVQAPAQIIDSYAHSQVPGAIETQHIPYYQSSSISPYHVDPISAYQSDNPLGSASVIRYRLVPEIVARDPLLVRDYRSVTARDGEVMQRAGLVGELYNPERVVLSSTQSAYWSAGHSDPTRAYADSLPLPASNGSAPLTIPSSSFYSFAGATASYR